MIYNISLGVDSNMITTYSLHILPLLLFFCALTCDRTALNAVFTSSKFQYDLFERRKRSASISNGDVLFRVPSRKLSAIDHKRSTTAAEPRMKFTLPYSKVSNLLFLCVCPCVLGKSLHFQIHQSLHHDCNHQFLIQHMQ